MRGTCFRIPYLMFVCADIVYFVGYGGARACHPLRSTSAANARLARAQGPFQERNTHPIKGSKIRLVARFAVIQAIA